MKNIVHTLTLAQMRANPRRTLVTLVGVVLSVTMLTAVFAGADSFLNFCTDRQHRTTAPGMAEPLRLENRW